MPNYWELKTSNFTIKNPMKSKIIIIKNILEKVKP